MFNLLPLLMASEFLTSSNMAAISFGVVGIFIVYKIVRKLWKYPVTLIDSQTQTVIKEYSLRKGAKVKLEPAVKNGETFIGWSYAPDGSKPCEGKNLIVEGKTVIYAMWDRPIAKEVIAIEDANMYMELGYADESGNIMKKETLPLIVNAPRTYNDYGRFSGWKEADGDIIVKKHYEGSTVSVTLYPVFSKDVGVIEKEEEDASFGVETFSAVDANMYVEFNYSDLDGNAITSNLMPIVATFPKVFDGVDGFEGWAFEPNGAIEVDKDFIDSVISFQLAPAGLEDIHKPAPVVEEAPAAEEVVEEAPAAEEVVEEAPVAEEAVEEAPVVEEVVEEAPAAEETVEEAPVAEEVVEEAPVAEETVEEAPAAEEVVEEAPAAEEVVEEAPAAEEVVEEAPVVEEAVVEEAPAVEETVEEAPAAEEVVEEAPATEEVVEEAPVVEETVEEAPVVEAAPVAEPEPEVPAEPVAPTIVPTYFDNEGNHIDIKYSRSFISNIIQGDEMVKEYYSDLKNHILSYEGVKSRLSWKFDSYNRGRDQLFKIKVRGKTICIYLALDPDNYEVSKYHHEAIDAKIFEDVPMLFKIKSGLGLRKAKQLVDDTMARFDIPKNEKAKFVDYVAKYPYTETEELVQQKLVKVLVSDSSVTVKSAKKSKKADAEEEADLKTAVIEEAPVVIEIPVEEPVAEAVPAVEEAVVEEAPVAEEAVEEAPVVEEAVEEAPVAEEAVEEAPAVEEAVEEAPVAEEAVVEEAPVVEEAVEETPAAEEAVEEAPAVEEAVEEAPVAEEAVEEAPVVEEAVEEAPVAEEEPEEINVVESVSADEADAMVKDETVDKTVEADVEYVSKNDTKKAIINVGVLSDNYEAGETVDLASLKAKKLIDAKAKSVKVLASGKINKPLTVKAQVFSETAIKMIVLTGGKAIKVVTKVK